MEGLREQESKIKVLKNFVQSFNNSFNNTFILYISTCLFPILFFSCENNNKIEQDKFVLIYTDFLIAQDTASVNEKNLDSLRSSVFSKYNVTENEYETTIEYYNEEIERWEEFFDKVTAHIETLNQKD